MNIKTVKLIYFSPTQTTKKVVEGIVQGMNVDNIEHIDLTLPNRKTESIKFSNNDFVIFGMPVYGGRIPAMAVSMLERFKGENTMAGVVVAYGNRAYDDALLELKNIVSESGFKPIAAGAFIGEHSFSKKEYPIAKGRPDKEDIVEAEVFGKEIVTKIQKIKSVDEISTIDVPGNFPYKEGMAPSKASTSTDNDICTMCETCATVCPVEAITYEDEVITDKDKCILCCACVRVCPTEARGLEVPPLLEKIKQMSENLKKQKNAELFI